MRQERIALADILPDKNNPRKKFEGIKELADTFSLTPGRPGEPFNPPIVIQDGSKYRIVDGHRRHKAMKRLKTETCLVFVAEDFEEASSMLMMLATDEKQRLTDVEKSKGLQGMLATGVDPVEVEKVGYLPKGSAKKIKKAMELAEGTEQMSLERMFAIAEFDGDDEAVRKLSECAEKELGEAVANIRKKREREEAKAAFAAVVEKHGAESVDTYPSGYEFAQRFKDPAELAEYLAECEEAGEAKVKISDYLYSPVDVIVYLPAKEKEIDPEEEKLKEERDRHIAVYRQGAERRMAWIVQKLARPTDELPRISEEVEADEERFDWQWHGVFECIGDEADVPAGPSEIIWHMWSLESYNYGLYFYCSNDEYEPSACDNFAHIIELLKSEGYEPDESEAAMYEEAKAVIETEEDEEADEENLEA